MFQRLTVACVVVLCVGSAHGQKPVGNRENDQRVVQPSPLQLLNQRIPEVQFDGTPLGSVMEWLADITGANVVVRWETLEGVGIERDQPVTVKAKNLRLSQVLWLVMNAAGGTDVELAYRASGSVLVLSTAEDLDRETVVKVYDVADLLGRPPKFDNAPTLDPSQALSQQGFTVFQAGPHGERRATEDRSESIDNLVELIMKAIEPDSWAVNGAGGSGYIHAYGNVLVVSNSLRVHQRIGGCIVQGTSGP